MTKIMHIVHTIGGKMSALARELSHEDLEFDVSVGSNSTQGDITSNIALVHFKKLGFNSPREAAVKFAAEFEAMKDTAIERIEVAGPGFINFYLSFEYLTSLLQKNTQPAVEEIQLDTSAPQKKKVIVEFGDPNPFKEIHIGHLRNFCIGESFSRLLESQGNEVVRAIYQGDVGLHVAKALWGLLHIDYSSSEARSSERDTVLTGSSNSKEITPQVLAKAYVHGATEFENNEVAKQEIVEINKRIYREDEELKPLWEEGRKVSLDKFEELYERLGIVYKSYYFESVTAKKGKEIVLSHIEDGIFERGEKNAVIYKGERDGLHTRVFLTAQEYATYEGKDLALAVLKGEDGWHDESVILTGNEQLEYFQVMLSALKRISPELAEKTTHLTYGHVRLKEGKMASRTGNVITATWLLDEAVKRVKEAFPEVDDMVAEKIGVGAVKYSMLKFSIPSDIHFSFEESVSLEGNSGPYLQYSYVRTQSVLAKASVIPSETKNLSRSFTDVQNDNIDLEPEEKDLLRFLSQYNYHLEVAANEFAPNLLCNYLFELAQKFNHFYQKCKVIGSENEAFRLELTRSVGDTLKNGLQALGIETVEKM